MVDIPADVLREHIRRGVDAQFPTSRRLFALGDALDLKVFSADQPRDDSGRWASDGGAAVAERPANAHSDRLTAKGMPPVDPYQFMGQPPKRGVFGHAALITGDGALHDIGQREHESAITVAAGKDLRGSRTDPEVVRAARGIIRVLHVPDSHELNVEFRDRPSQGQLDTLQAMVDANGRDGRVRYDVHKAGAGMVRAGNGVDALNRELANSFGGTYRLEDFDSRFKVYNPDQPRDDHGRFGSGGGAAVADGKPDVDAAIAKAGGKPMHPSEVVGNKGYLTPSGKLWQLDSSHPAAAASVYAQLGRTPNRDLGLAESLGSEFGTVRFWGRNTTLMLESHSNPTQPQWNAIEDMVLQGYPSSAPRIVWDGYKPDSSRLYSITDDTLEGARNQLAARGVVQKTVVSSRKTVGENYTVYPRPGAPRLTKRDAGYVARGAFGCENCRWYKDGGCAVTGTSVEARGCCDLWNEPTAPMGVGKQRAEYIYAPDSDYTCAECKVYDPKARTCDYVLGSIAPEASCDKFEPDEKPEAKANPYHDERGRFASSENAEFVSLFGRPRDSGRVVGQTVPQTVINEHPEVARALGGAFTVSDEGTPVVQHALEDLDLVHPKMLAELRSKGLKFVELGDKPMTQMDSNQYLAGVRPRGSPAGSTWDQVPGGAKGDGSGFVWGKGQHGSASGALHELGHVFGSLEAWDNDPRVQAAHESARAARRLDPYYSQEGAAGRQEFLAESISSYLKDGPSITTGRYGADIVSFLRDQGIANPTAHKATRATSGGDTRLPRRLPNGKLLVPARAEADGVIGDGAIEISADDPDYVRWLEFVSPEART